MRTLTSLPRNITGREFQTDEGTRFSVLAGEYFPRNSIGRSHRKYLWDLREGLLVSVSFYGQPVPVITVDGGVMRLVQITASGKPLKGAAVISKFLGVVETRQPMGLYPA